eukprot:c3353_g2_i1 orf=3-263(-)
MRSVICGSHNSTSIHLEGRSPRTRIFQEDHIAFMLYWPVTRIIKAPIPFQVQAFCTIFFELLLTNLPYQFKPASLSVQAYLFGVFAM